LGTSLATSATDLELIRNLLLSAEVIDAAATRPVQ
jgi:hypothetical protein